MTEIIEVDTPRLRMRRWRDEDRQPFAAMNADPEVMEYFTSPQGRDSSDASIDGWQAELDQHGWSNWALEERGTGEFLGFAGLSTPRRAFPFSPCVEVGWRLARPYWGKGFATEAALASLRVGFQRLHLAEIVSFAAIGNIRSRAVMKRIGMLDAHEDFEHPGVPAGHALRWHCLYRIGRGQWAVQNIL